MSLTDKDIDKLYSAGVERLSFEYKQSYWDEFDSQLSSAQDADTPKEPLSDAQIDGVFTTGAAGLAFEYKPSYWDEFNASLPESTPADSPKKESLTDTEIDAMYASGAAGLAFDYKPSYWDEFNASLPESSPIDVPENALTDAEIDSMYAASAAGLSFDYHNDYWNEFNDIAATGNAVLADNAIDELYQESANDLSFQYKPSYWEEMKLRLRRKRRPDFLWFATAYTFVGVIGVSLFMNGSSLEETGRLVAESNNVESTNNNNNSTSNKVNQSDANVITNEADNSNNNTSSNSNASDPINGNEPDVNQVGAIEPVVKPTVPSEPINEVVQGSTPIKQVGKRIDKVPSRLISLLAENNNVDTKEDTRQGDNTLNNDSNIDPKTGVPTQEAGTNDLATEDDERIILPINDLERTPIDKSLAEFSPLDLRPKTKPFTFGYVQAVGGLSQSLVTPSDQSSYSFGLGLGMEVQHNNLTYTFGVNGLVDNHNDLVLNRTAKVYGFGSDVYKFNIDYKQMYTLEGVLGVGYNFGKHKLDLGIRPSFVVSTRVRIEELGTSSGVLANEDNDYNESRDVFGFMDGIHRFGLKPTIGYAFRITPSFSFGANIGVQVMPAINEDFINGVNNKLPIDGQVYLRKTLSFRKNPLRK